MNIGDLFFTFRGDGAKLQADAQKEGAKAGEPFGKAMLGSIQKSWSGANIGQGFIQGLGLAGGLGAVNVISDAIGRAVGIGEDAIAAFREDQVSIQKLGTALRDNVPAWDGNTAAIERTIKARTSLGFSDDEQRAGLATLVGSTHDATKALELEAGAMDIARARHVDLATATDAVAKAYAGNTKGLKSLIPGLNLGKSSAEALANAFRTVKGAADDYAKTDEGKVLVAQAKVNEAMERLGSLLSGPVADGAVTAADALERVIGALDAMPDAVHSNEDPLDNLGNLLHDLFKKPEEPARTFFGTLGDGLNELNNNLGDSAAAINDWWTFWDSHSNLAQRQAQRNAGAFNDMTDAVHDMRVKEQADLGAAQEASSRLADGIEGDRGRIGDALHGVSTATSDVARDTANATSRIRDLWRKAVDAIAAAGRSLISDAFDPIIAKDNLVAENAEVNAQKKILASKRVTSEQKQAARDAQAAMDQTMQSVANNLLTLAQTGDTTSKAFQTGLANLKEYAKGVKGSAGVALQGVITTIEQMVTAAKNANPRITVHVVVPEVAVKVSGGGPNRGATINPVIEAWRLYARGGIVDAPIGTPVPAIVHGGERVLTPEQQKQWGDTFNVSVNVDAVPGASIQDSRRQGQVILDVVAAGLREQTARRMGDAI